eukprot:TRINITY_DN18778_c0_g1_i1.p1 TRINITY_DN18778_c0_g1~~TRINITY_DN18778_c0_g1_i1.p1  ORF type:complete len:704 (+),score=124.88 TRINITY_DN18778_c0_g1_i1:205-2316(+)
MMYSSIPLQTDGNYIHGIMPPLYQPIPSMDYVHPSMIHAPAHSNSRCPYYQPDVTHVFNQTEAEQVGSQHIPHNEDISVFNISSKHKENHHKQKSSDKHPKRSHKDDKHNPKTSEAKSHSDRKRKQQTSDTQQSRKSNTESLPEATATSAAEQMLLPPSQVPAIPSETVPIRADIPQDTLSSFNQVMQLISMLAREVVQSQMSSPLFAEMRSKLIQQSMLQASILLKTHISNGMPEHHQLQIESLLQQQFKFQMTDVLQSQVQAAVQNQLAHQLQSTLAHEAQHHEIEGPCRHNIDHHNFPSVFREGNVDTNPNPTPFRVIVSAEQPRYPLPELSQQNGQTNGCWDTSVDNQFLPSCQKESIAPSTGQSLNPSDIVEMQGISQFEDSSPPKKKQPNTWSKIRVDLSTISPGDTTREPTIQIDSKAIKDSRALWKTGKFSKKEDEILLAAIDEYITKHELGEVGYELLCDHNTRKQTVHHHAWDIIAKCLPHRRSSAVQEHGILQISEKNYLGKWSKEEEDRLRELVPIHGSQWQLIGPLVGRLPRACRDKWRDLYRRHRKGPWAEDEKKRLLELVERFSSNSDQPEINWSAISEHMQTRNQTQCRETWYTQLDPTIRPLSFWTVQDDQDLIKSLVLLDVDDETEIDWSQFTSVWKRFQLKNKFQRLAKWVSPDNSMPLRDILAALCEKLNLPPPESILSHNLN